VEISIGRSTASAPSPTGDASLRVASAAVGAVIIGVTPEEFAAYLD